jgi:hypothetical protein
VFSFVIKSCETSYQDVLAPHREKLRKAEAQVRALERELESARGAVLSLKRILEHVANTVEQCQAVAVADKRVPKLSTPVRKWLISLARFEVFGSAEGELLAKELGEIVKPDAIRQRLAQLVNSGALEKRGRGHYSVDRTACENLIGIDWGIESETEVERAARLDRAQDAQIDMDNRLREEREASRVRRLQADRSSDIELDLDNKASETISKTEGSTNVGDEASRNDRLWDHRFDSLYDEEPPW